MEQVIRRRKMYRLGFIGFALSVVGLCVAAAFYVLSLSDSVAFFYSPTDLQSANLVQGQRLRLGGIVEPGSLQKTVGKTVSFSVKDGEHVVHVVYTGLLPDLFAEGQGVVVEGVLESENRVVADRVLAKHDEFYMPPEVAAHLKEQGLWKPDL